MPDFGCTIDNSGFDTYLEGVREKLRLLVKKTVNDVTARAMTFAPVDTGALKSSIQPGPYTNDGLSGVVNVGVEYGIYQEFGTVHMAAHPYLTPAVDAYRAPFLRVVAKIVGGSGGSQE